MIILRQNNYSNLPAVVNPNLPAVVKPNLPAVVNPVSTPEGAVKAGGGIGSWMKANPGKAALGALAFGGTMLAAKKIKDKQNTEKDK